MLVTKSQTLMPDRLLGAGDVLHGAFCHYFALDPNFPRALRKASAVATLSCQSLGLEEWAKEK
jgi:sugar/nucleoside kinase (ribokinase family)